MDLRGWVSMGSLDRASIIEDSERMNKRTNANGVFCMSFALITLSSVSRQRCSLNR